MGRIPRRGGRIAARPYQRRLQDSLESSVWIDRGKAGLEFPQKGLEPVRSELLANFQDFGSGENIAAFVQLVAGVALEPFPGDAMSGGFRVEFFPEILVFHGRLGFGFPAKRLPVPEPFGDAIADVL